MFDSCEIRIHPTGKAIARFGTKSQGQGHETTYAQILAEELGIPAADIQVEEGDTDTAPYGLGTYASRSTPVAGAAAAMAARKIQDKARKIAAHLLEAAPDDLVWEPGRFSVKGAPDRGKTIQDIAFAAYTNHPQGMEAGLEAVSYYDPPNLTFPFGSYICVVDIDTGTGEVKIRRFVAVDDCGNIINPMIVEGQIHGGLTMGLAPALFEEISYDEQGNIQGGSFIDYLRADRGGDAPLGDGQHVHAVAPSPARRQGRGRVGHGGRAGRHRQRGGRRALAPRGAPRRHPDHAGQGLEAPAGARRGGVADRARTPASEPDVLALAVELPRAGRAVRARHRRALRAPDLGQAWGQGPDPRRRLDGGLGGRSLRRARRGPRGAGRARATASRGSSRLVGEAGPGPGPAEGVLEHAMTCHSGGTLEIYVEPFLPRPLLVLVGHGPVVETLAALGRATEFAVALVDAEAHGRELARLPMRPDTSVVVATHGRFDEDALGQALAGGPAT